MMNADVLWHRGDFVRHYEAKLLDNQPALRNLITGIDTPSRQAMERIIASVQIVALDWTRPAVAAHYQPVVGRMGIGKLASAGVVRMIAAFATALPKETLALTAEGVAQASKINFKSLGAMTGSAALAALDFSEFAQDRGHIETFQTSYSGRLAATLRDVLNESEITGKSVQPLETLIQTKIASLPQNRVSAEGMFTLFITLLAVITSYERDRCFFSSSDRSLAAAHSKQLSHIMRGVLENTSRMIPQTDDNTYYRVIRPVGVSVRPKPQPYQMTGLLVPDQTVRLVERSHRWVSVEYFDQLHGVARQGWAPKKYFEQMSAAAAQPAKAPVSLVSDERIVIDERWEETNKRRIDLIFKKAESKLTASEQVELDRLQDLTDEHLHLVAPLPLSAIDAIMENLERSN